MSRFLLVSLNIKAILQETTLHRRRAKLSAMTNGLGLGDAYDATIERIKLQEGDGARLGMDALMWISHSERPLNVDEICHALAVDIGSTNINMNNVPSIRTVLGCCQGLAALDEGSSTIRLIHFTLKEYLSCHGDLFDRPHSKMAETCLTYLNFELIKGPSDGDFHYYRRSPFLEYSSLYWGTHMRMEPSVPSRSLALDLLGQYDNHISAKFLWKSATEPRFNPLKPFSALHCISYFGIAEVAIDLLRTKKWDVNQRDSAGLTPLMWAAMHGHEAVVKLLLEHKRTQPDIPDIQHGRTALLWAAKSGQERVVRLFLGPKFVNPRRIGRRWGKTPQVMSVLFGRKCINPDEPDNGGRTPLLWAACGGYCGVVNLLLTQEGISPDKPDHGGQTPLSLAAWNGHDKVVKILLEREDVNPDRPGSNGETPLLLAATDGHDEVVQQLLARGDDSPDRPNNESQTPLSEAAWGGHDGIVRQLLGRGDVSPDRRDNDGRTPLLLAACYGRDAVVELPPGRKDVSHDSPDKNGRTPLWWAARGGHGGVARQLLELEDVDPDRPDNYGQTPLSCAARDGHDCVAKQLLGRGDVSPERADNDGQTPLSQAASGGRDGVVKLLLQREDVSYNRPDNDGRTPVSLAAQNGHGGVVKLLEARGAVAPVWYRPWRYDLSLRLLG